MNELLLCVVALYLLCDVVCVISRARYRPPPQCRLCMRDVPEGWARCSDCTNLLNRRQR